MVLVGFFALIGVTSSVKDYNKRQFMFVAGLILSYLFSALFTANYERVFHGLTFIIINCSVALALVSAKQIYWFGFFLNYIAIAFFSFNFLIGVDPRDVFSHTSYNSISIILIMSCIVTYILNYIGNKKITVFPAVLTCLFCVWAIGRGGVVSSFFLLLGILYCKYPGMGKKYLLFLSVPLLFFFSNTSYESLIDYFSFLDAVSLAIDRSSQVEPRLIIWNEYVSNLKLYDYIFGVNIFERSGQALSDVAFNFHNSFLSLHSRVGFYALIILVATIFSLYRFYIFNKLYFILFLTLIIRASTDGFIFFESFDFIYYYFIFYAFSFDFKTRHLETPGNSKLGTIMEKK
jgi:hypothetical protein